MLQNEMITKIEQLREWESILEEAQAEVEAIRDCIKTQMLDQGTEELQVGTYIVRWTSVLSTRFDSTAFNSDQKANTTSFEEKMFHIIRAFHVAGRCTDSGECSRVCPQGIPLHLFNRKFIKDINSLYGEYQAGVDAEAKAPLTSFTQEDAEPSIVAEGGLAHA